MVQDVREHLIKFDNGDPAYDLQRTVAGLAAEMAVLSEGRDKLVERQLKFAAFSAFVLRPQRGKVVHAGERRLVWPTPCIDPVIYGRHNVRDKLARMADTTQPEELRDDKDINNIAHVYAQLALIFWETTDAAKWRARADHYFAEGCRRHPLSLCLQFNRAVWTFLQATAARADAVNMFRELLNHWDKYEFDPLNSDMGFAYTVGDGDRVFPYYTYGQLVTTYAAQGDSALIDVEVLKDVIKGAVFGYLGWEAIERRDSKEASPTCANR